MDFLQRAEERRVRRQKEHEERRGNFRRNTDKSSDDFILDTTKTTSQDDKIREKNKTDSTIYNTNIQEKFNEAIVHNLQSKQMLQMDTQSKINLPSNNNLESIEKSSDFKLYHSNLESHTQFMTIESKRDTFKQNTFDYIVGKTSDELQVAHTKSKNVTDSMFHFRLNKNSKLHILLNPNADSSAILVNETASGGESDEEFEESMRFGAIIYFAVIVSIVILVLFFNY